MRLAYRAWDGAGKAIADVVDAATADEARETLRRRGLFVTEINESSAAAASTAGSGGSLFARKPGRTARLKMLSSFCRQLYVLVKTGTPVVQALEAVERQTRDATFRRVVTSVRSRVEEGVPLSEAMTAHGDFFDPVSRSLIHAGETAGKLPTMLERIGVLARKQVQLRSNIMGAMIYPTLLISISMSVLVLMMTFVLPRFATMFEDMEAPLPPTTKALMAVSDILRGYWWAVIGVLAVGVAGIVAWLRTEAGRRFRDTLLIRLPGIGPIVRNFATARIARLTGILLDSYLPLLDVIALVKESATNIHYRRILADAEKAVTHGEPMSSALSDPALINQSAYEALRNGESTGQIAPLMLTVADFMEEENETVVKSLTSILEPVILIVLGLVIGFVAVSMFLPLFDLTAAVSGKK